MGACNTGHNPPDHGVPPSVGAVHLGAVWPALAVPRLVETRCAVSPAAFCAPCQQCQHVWQRRPALNHLSALACNRYCVMLDGMMRDGRYSGMFRQQAGARGLFFTTAPRLQSTGPCQQRETASRGQVPFRFTVGCDAGSGCWEFGFLCLQQGNHD